jgi:FMN-dependent NADH-azoreductase
MKTLLIKYLPSGQSSNTKKLLDLFLSEIKDSEIKTVDLLEAKIPIFNLTSMSAYYKRNFHNLPLNQEEANSLSENDQLVKQLKSCDILVMAYPMHNFGMPALVKAYLDAVLLNGETFSPGKKIMIGKKSLTLFTSGGNYNSNLVNLEYPNWDTLTMLAKINFGFMGFDESEVINTSLRDPATEAEKLAQINIRIKDVVKRWYNVP